MYTTLETVVSHGVYYVLGRGACGMRVMKVAHDGSIVTVNDCGIPFSDDNGWSDRSYYSTIRVVVLHDVIYVLGRGACGIHVYKLVDDAPRLVSECEIAFSDADGWNVEKYYATLRAVPAADCVYVMARGSCGMYVFRICGDSVEKVDVCGIPLSDEYGWYQRKYFATIRAIALHEHVYVIARAAHGVVIYRTVAPGQVQLVNSGDIPFSDDKWWDSAEYYETIRVAANDVSVFVLGRSSCGMVVYQVFGGDVTLVSSCEVEFFDYLGWDSENRYSTIGTAVVDNVLYVYGRDACGIKLYRMDRAAKAGLVSDCLIEFSNAKWWNLVKYYSSIRGLDGVNGVAISGRSTCGVTIYDGVESGKLHTVAECI